MDFSGTLTGWYQPCERRKVFVLRSNARRERKKTPEGIWREGGGWARKGHYEFKWDVCLSSCLWRRWIGAEMCFCHFSLIFCCQGMVNSTVCIVCTVNNHFYTCIRLVICIVTWFACECVINKHFRIHSKFEWNFECMQRACAPASKS